MVVLVRTDCDSAPEGSDPAWTGAADAPDWGETLTRTLRMVTTHSLFEDLRRAGKINDQLELHGRAGRTARGRRAGRSRTERPGEARRLAERRPPGGADRKLRAAAGLEHKSTVDISEIVGRSGEVAGASLARFGGFFAERTRGHDFLLGYRNGLIWMWNNLQRRGPRPPARDDRGARPGDDDPRLDRRSWDARQPRSPRPRAGARRRRPCPSHRPQQAGGPAVTAPLRRDGSATVAAGNGGAWALPERFHDGRYRTLRQLGSGASKRVVVAYDEELEREVAVAVIRSADLSDGERARLLREVRVDRAALQPPEHPHRPRRGRAGRVHLRRPGARRRRLGRGAARHPPERAAARARAADRARRHRGAGVRPRERRDPSRRQAEQRAADAAPTRRCWRTSA